jgi:signal transduction histidine kinase
VARRVVEVVRRTPHAERIAFAIEMPAGLSASIDEGDLTELLGNLIENAARFAKARVQISAERRPAGTAITVADDGPGIPEADRDAVLRRGVSLGAARVTHGDGTRASVRDTGLGLAIVADIVESYRGELVLGDAKPGLVVTVVLPTFVAEA